MLNYDLTRVLQLHYPMLLYTKKMVTILTLYNITKRVLQQNMTITGSKPFYKTMKNVLPYLDKRDKRICNLVVVSLFVSKV